VGGSSRRPGRTSNGTPHANLLKSALLVGNNAASNTNGVTYDYVAFKNDP
jgi:hypothetical protein